MIWLAVGWGPIKSFYTFSVNSSKVNLVNVAAKVNALQHPLIKMVVSFPIPQNELGAIWLDEKWALKAAVVFTFVYFYGLC